MKRLLGVPVILVVLASLVFVAGITAGTTAKDVIEMKAPYDHTKGLVSFTHQKHTTDYKIGCGDCHHDDKGKPLTNLKPGDDVKSCWECHNKPGEIKGKEAKGLSKAEELKYHANALHENCLGCHKKWNKDNNSKAAPTKCTDCHPKTS